MAKFYHELWKEKRPPVEALRRAQLFVYRMSPERIEEVTRGPIQLNKALVVEPEESRRGGRGLAPAKLWAAFVLSGAGRAAAD
jgi:CHAT domain-containing protein